MFMEEAREEQSRRPGAGCRSVHPTRMSASRIVNARLRLYRPAQPFNQELIDQRIRRTRPRHDSSHTRRAGMLGFLNNPTEEHRK